MTVIQLLVLETIIHNTIKEVLCTKSPFLINKKCNVCN